MTISADSTRCFGEYKATRVSADLVVLVGRGEHPKKGYTQSFERVDTDTYRFIHVAPLSGPDEETPFIERLNLPGSTGKVLHIIDIFGPIDVPVDPLPRMADAVTAKDIPGAYSLGRSVES